MRNSHNGRKSMKIPLGNLTRKICSTKHEVALGVGLGQKKEAEFIHSQSKKKRRKNHDQKTVTGKESKLKLHAQPATLAPPK
jgi:hypothetical protein